MIQPILKDDELTIEGTIEVGDSYESLCCDGYAWKVVYVFPGKHMHEHSVYGACANPDCPQERDSHYHGVSNYLTENLALLILDKQEEQP